LIPLQALHGTPGALRLGVKTLAHSKTKKKRFCGSSRAHYTASASYLPRATGPYPAIATW